MPIVPPCKKKSVNLRRSSTTAGKTASKEEADDAKRKPKTETMAEKTKRSKTRAGTTAAALAFKPQMEQVDFDLYLAESLTPCLAQALDALGREIIRQKETGDKMDKNVLRRFNPRTWLAQPVVLLQLPGVVTPGAPGLAGTRAWWDGPERGPYS